jgi:small multidrug resistance pump
MQFFFLFLSGTFSASASILLRIAGRVDSDPSLFGISGKPLLCRLAAIAAYGAGFALYALALKRVDLSVAYPLMVAVTILEILVFGVAIGEAVSLRIVAGAVLLLISVLLLYLPAKAGA